MRALPASIRTAFALGLFSTIAVPAFAQRGPAATATKLPADVLSLACAPSLTYEAPVPSLLVTGGQDGHTRKAFAPGDLITINGGVMNGIEVGQEYYVRRAQAATIGPVGRNNPVTVRTTGWVKVWAVDPKMSLVTVSHACDSIEIGDYLEPFAIPKLPVMDQNPAKPQRENYALIVSGSDNRSSFGKGDFFVVNRGSSGGIAPGDRFIIYRDKDKAEGYMHKSSVVPREGEFNEFLFNLGEAVAVDVKADTSTLRAITTRDAFKTGDYVAIRK